ncbi:hypothetical protein GC101_05800 [Paenibacillus sp. LMG 31459]|uniref:BIG2 domain-containing protein n=1 Tax=Paenibacillus phytohabitans TaxID=2654978 RepID=A0ABX1YEE5_9BACL|nr:Ig-like domain-containing protein [Paenibacillus phytohabitans]NOU78391.1 hypothetical protein [Paenibacillus phytohabitans]
MKLIKNILLVSVLTLSSVTLVTIPTLVVYADQAAKVISISVASPSNALKPKQTFQLKPNVVTSPKGTNVKITYSSTNTKVATVNVSGLVTAVNPGKAIIYTSSGGKSTYVVINVASSTVSLSTGLWVEKKDIKNSEEQLLTDGAIYFELKSFKNNVLTGHFFSISSPPSNRIADVEIRTEIKNGKGIFSYTDDGWGNSGKGTVEIKGDNLLFGFKETKSDSSAMWNLGSFSVTLYKSNSGSNVDVKAFEGQWSTPGSDELAFKLTIKSDTKGVITFFSEGEEFPNNITFVHNGDKLTFKYEDSDQKTTLKLVDSKTIKLTTTDGYQLTLKKY